VNPKKTKLLFLNVQDKLLSSFSHPHAVANVRERQNAHLTVRVWRTKSSLSRSFPISENSSFNSVRIKNQLPTASKDLKPHACVKLLNSWMHSIGFLNKLVDFSDFN
jgi:hypothetical protein